MRILPLVLAAAVAACTPPPEGPDLILTGGTVYTAGLETTATALAIDGDRIVAVGGDAEVRALAVDGTQEMALDGAPVLGGFTDHWVDLEAVGRWQQGLDLTRSANPREVQARVREAAAGGDGWIVGRGWDETAWPDGSLPDRRALDEVAPARPVLLYRRTGDLGWVNGAALDRAEVEAAAPGVFADADGRPTGIVAGPALRRVEDAIPAPPEDARREWLAEGLRQVAAAGITTVRTAPLDEEAIDLLRDLERTGDVPIRVRARRFPGDAAGSGGDERGVDDAAAPGVVVTAVGLTLDGPFRPPLAAVVEPYPEGGTGSLWLEPPAIAAACEAAARAGLALDVRARGDRALADALEACPGLAAGDGMVVGADLLPSPARELAGVRIGASPGRLAHDVYWLERALGPDRARRTHAYRDALAAGLLAGLASEAPEHPLAPMALVQVLATRRDASGYPVDGWVPAQRVAVADTLRLATGALTPGAVADLVVWSADPLAADTDLSALQAMLTIVGGRVVYSRPLVSSPFEMD